MEAYGCPASIRRVLDNFYGPERPSRDALAARESAGESAASAMAAGGEQRPGGPPLAVAVERLEERL